MPDRLVSLTKEQLCNMALSKLGNNRSFLTNFDTDTGLVADLCRLHYDYCIQYISRMHDWSVTVSHNRLPIRQFSVTFKDPGIPNLDEKRYDCKPFVGIARADYAVQDEGSDAADPDDNVWSTTQTIEYVTDRWIIYTKNSGGVKTAIIENVTTETVPPLSGWTTVSAYASSVTEMEVKEFRPQPTWKHRFQTPDNCVRVIYVTNTQEVNERVTPNVYWTMDEDGIMCNEPDIYIRFNRLISLHKYDTLGKKTRGEHDSLFREAFITLLAAKLATGINGDRDLEERLMDEFLNVHIPEAKRVNGFEKNPSPVLDSEWLEATYTSNNMTSNSSPPFSQTSYGTFE